MEKHHNNFLSHLNPGMEVGFRDGEEIKIRAAVLIVILMAIKFPYCLGEPN